MPMYTYRCPVCTTEVKLLKKVDDRDDLPECEECGHEASRVVGAGLQKPIIEGNRPRIKKAVPPGVNRDTLDRDWLKDT